MKKKYISFFKKELVFLIVLLFVVCFSFGVTYSNFIYNSNDKRAVEMFATKLNYNISINDSNESKILVNPGINVFKIKITSLNEISSYYKLTYKDNFTTLYYNNTTDSIIRSNESIESSLIVFNNHESSKYIEFEVLGGFMNNKLEDIKIPSDYNYVNSFVNDLDEIIYNEKKYKILNINSKGDIKLIGNNVYDTNINIYGASGYNSIDSLDNYIVNTIYCDKCRDVRNVTLKDMEEYLESDALVYFDNKIYNEVYVPNTIMQDATININNINIIEEEMEYKLLSNITFKSLLFNDELLFKKDRYKDVFLNSNYSFSTKYYNAKDIIEFGIVSINNSNIVLNKLYDSQNNGYDLSLYARPILIMDDYELYFENEVLKIK